VTSLFPALDTLVERVERLAFSLRLWQLGVGLLVVAGLTNGVWHTPNLPEYLAIAHEFPRAPVLGGGDYILSSPLGGAIASWLGIRSELGFVLLHLAVLLAGLVALVITVFRKFGDLAARAVMVVLFSSPLANLLLSWLGQPDPFTFIAASAIVVLDAPVLLVLATLGLGANAFEQGIFIVGGAAALRLFGESLRGASGESEGESGGASRRRGVVRVGAMGVGLVAGKAALEAYHRHYGITPDDRFAFVLFVGFGGWFSRFFANFGTWLFSIFNAAWVAGALLVFFAVPVATSLDETRVYALISWPVLLWLTLWAVRRECAAVARRLVAITLLAGVVLPRVIVWEANIYASSARLMFGWLIP